MIKSIPICVYGTVLMCHSLHYNSEDVSFKLVFLLGIHLYIVHCNSMYTSICRLCMCVCVCVCVCVCLFAVFVVINRCVRFIVFNALRITEN